MGKLLDYALLSQRAYSQNPDIGVESSASRAIIDTTPDGLCVAFPGTNNPECLLTDIDALTVMSDGLGELHRGAWEAFEAISAPLMHLRPAVVCGHSEGAWLALIYSGALCLAGFPPQCIFAYEPPRMTMDNVLDSLLAAHGVKSILTRNGNDIITQVPSWMRQTDRLTRIGQPIYPFDNISDHYISNVITSIENSQ